MKLATTRPSPPPAPPFVWLDNSLHPHDPAEMDTRHLFNVVSMIWNHGMPDDAATHDYVRYHFPRSTHGPAYLRLAICKMLPILLRRDNLTAGMLARLDFMRAYLAKRPDLLPEPLPALEAPR